MPTVYGIQEPPPFFNRQTGSLVEKDLSSAQRYGKLMFLLNRQDKPSTMPAPCYRKIAAGLKDFMPDDYIFFPGGDFLALFMAGAALYAGGYREFNWLKWEKERDTDGSHMNGGFYVPVKVPMNF